MVRLTEEQLRFGEAMKLMIDLYYQLKALDPKFIKVGDLSDAWYSEPLILRMANIFNLTIPNFSPCLYFVESSRFRYRGKGEAIYVTRGGLTNFIEAMDALKTDISKKMTVCFNFDEIITVSREQVGTAGGQKEAAIEKTKSIKDHKLKCVVVPHLDWSAATTKERGAYVDKKRMALNTVPPIMDSFQLGSCDSELQSVVSVNFNIINFVSDSNYDRIGCPGFSGEKSSPFFDVIAYLLIKYQWLFGSFERVKECKHCSKLFFEKRLGKKEFCGGLCRKRYNDNLQPPESRHCRDRQNQWMANHSAKTSVSTIHRVNRDNCAECDGTKKSGECPALIINNKIAFKELATGNRKRRF